MKDNIPNQKRSILLHGDSGTGKTLMAVNFAKHSKFSFVKFISPENYVGMSDLSKVQAINKIF
jgi:vesicle-fusing ATPase